MIYSLVPQTAAESPVTVDEQKTWMRVSHNKHNSLIADLLNSATEQVETVTGLTLSPRQYVYEAIYDRAGLAPGFRLPRRPVTAIASVKRVADDGTESALTLGADYWVGAARRITFRGGFPLLAGEAIKVEFTAGLAGSDTVPEALKLVIRREVDKHYTYSSNAIVGTAVIVLPRDALDALLPFREVIV